MHEKPWEGGRGVGGGEQHFSSSPVKGASASSSSSSCEIEDLVGLKGKGEDQELSPSKDWKGPGRGSVLLSRGRPGSLWRQRRVTPGLQSEASALPRNPCPCFGEARRRLPAVEQPASPGSSGGLGWKPVELFLQKILRAVAGRLLAKRLQGRARAALPGHTDERMAPRGKPGRLCKPFSHAA